MGVVYKITFPDGTFYIGATVNLENRMMQHRYHATNKLLKAKIKEFKMPKVDFIKLFSVLYEGDDFREVERDTIDGLDNRKKCLNIARVRWCHPERICRRIIQCSVEHNIYKDFKKIAEDLNTDTEGVINYLTILHKQEQERKARGFHR